MSRIVPGKRRGAMGRDTAGRDRRLAGHRRHARHHSENLVIWSSGHLVIWLSGYLVIALIQFKNQMTR
jgi:hypothetical protein